MDEPVWQGRRWKMEGPITRQRLRPQRGGGTRVHVQVRGGADEKPDFLPRSIVVGAAAADGANWNVSGLTNAS